MSYSDLEYMKYVKDLFKENSSDFDLVLSKLAPEDQERIKVATHFYYYICNPGNEETREEFKIIGLTSVIEYLMAGVVYKDPFKYFESEYEKDEITKDDYKYFKNSYLGKYGTTRKVVRYFDMYIPREDVEHVLDNITKLNKRGDKGEKFKDVEQLAKFIYVMRSEFVHNADMQLLCPPQYDFSLTEVGGKSYIVKVDIESILKIFEKSLVTFWEEKAS
jgi:uncharacterized protein YlzI (FlbEa/FlbD family)